MLVRAGPSLHYPIKVRELFKKVGDDVKPGDNLFEFEYTTIVSEGNDDGEMVNVPKTFLAEFQSENEGALIKWSIKASQAIERAG